MVEEIKHRHIAIVGVGGVGTHAALTCALVHNGNPTLIDRLVLIDGDRLEEKNFARIPLNMGWLGEYKINAVRSLIIDNNRTIHVVEKAHQLTADTIDLDLDGITDVICCTDDINSQRMLHMWCAQKGVRYQRAGYDGDTINVCRQMGLTFDVEAEAADAGYHGVPEAYHAILAGTLAVYSLLRNQVTIMGNLAELGIKGDDGLPLSIRRIIAEDTYDTDAAYRRELRDKVTQGLRDEGWHDGDDCEDNHDDCYTIDSLRDVAREEGWHSSGDCDHEDCILDVEEWIISNPDTTLSYLQDLHERGRHPEGCPWCLNEEDEVVTPQQATPLPPIVTVPAPLGFTDEE